VTNSREHGDDFTTFFKREYRQIVGVMMRAGASFEDAEDAVIEAMSLASPRFHQLDTPGAWVKRVALRIVTGKRKRDSERADREKLAATSEPARVDGGDEKRLVQSILDRMPPVQRKVLALTMDGHSGKEIASMIGSTMETVRSNLRHARKAMADGLRKAGWDIDDDYYPRQAG
jgi:RNA polymerase sigma factor (sigma-70 family)